MGIDYFKKVHIIFIFLFAANSLCAQEYSYHEDQRFTSYAAFVSKTWSITSKMPDGFKDLQILVDELLVRASEGDSGNDMIYCPVIQSNSEDCILMYAFVTTLYMMDLKDSAAVDNPYEWPQSQIIGEIETSLGLKRECPCCCQRCEPVIAFDDYVTTLTGGEAKDLFNVDRVYFYDLPVKHAYREKYIHSLGVVLAKKDRPDMFLKLCFTENGVKEKEKYIQMLKGKIWYEDAL
ncbi:MAG: hypothetical protein LBL18_02720 [Bacteroidales bacterium]|nr:hypothetical protein [Bacteroidales bacterium]